MPASDSTQIGHQTVISPASGSGSPALSKCLNSTSSLGSTDMGGVEPITGDKRKLPEALTLEDAKRIRVMGDIPMELVNEVMMTITDPAAMLGPEVSSSKLHSEMRLFPFNMSEPPTHQHTNISNG
ncbi:Histone acetyltransferase kat2a [Characodon lateralis]|uniref:Histone acetyltransferase kat2a n=1 Tax=Characodon lateralis TaxID=208331 RepID=A0ABU7F6B5_9TELE|nr:Histone acetyltransferase kat2a [Characodon lateralis]